MSGSGGTQWTHPSVVQLARGRDPVAAIIDLARQCVAKAIDQGWMGPPFDPFELADLRGIQLQPRHDLRDARTVLAKRDRLRIEFNPNRSQGRLRFSVAHEIAHTFFEDCGDRIRYRGQAHAAEEADAWQLETLCNLASAELLMPIGSFQCLASESLSIDTLLRLRDRFAVSTEAILIRAIRLTTEAAAAFVASRIDKGPHLGRYRIDYMIPSKSWGPRLSSGRLLPRSSAVHQCTAIGFTAKGQERWSDRQELQVQAVGLPPYPDSIHPRVAGIVCGPRERTPTSTITYLQGDATRPRSRPAIVAQVVNDATRNWGGSGFARAVRTRWPQVQESFRTWVPREGKLRLGQVHLAEADREIYVASLVAQKGYGPSARPRLRYAALRSGLQELATIARERKAKIHMPRIGCGEGQGDWSLIEELIQNECVSAGIDVVVYDLPGTKKPRSTQTFLQFSG